MYTNFRSIYLSMNMISTQNKYGVEDTTFDVFFFFFFCYHIIHKICTLKTDPEGAVTKNNLP